MSDRLSDASDGATERAAVHPSALEGSSPAVRWHRRRWLVLSAVAVGILLVTAVLSVGLRRDPTTIGTPLVGRPAPRFDLRTLDGSRRVTLSQLEGRVVVVNFWASWCKPCVEEHPALQAAWDRYRGRGVVVVGILYQDSTANGLDFMRNLGGDWPVVSDPDSRMALAYGVFGVPETFFIGPDGRVAHRELGAVSYGLLTEQISGLLGTRPG